MGILSALGLLGGLLWHGVVPFTIKSCQFCCSHSGQCLTSWYLLHSPSNSKTIRSLSLCLETGRGRLGYYVHML